CPGIIDKDGVILRGGQNLPGNWEVPDFNLTQELAGRLTKIDGETPLVVMHNDAVVQGLSEVPRMTDVEHWGVLTIGTGLGNARFTNTRRLPTAGSVSHPGGETQKTWARLHFRRFLPQFCTTPCM